MSAPLDDSDFEVVGTAPANDFEVVGVDPASRNWLQRNVGDPVARGFNAAQSSAAVVGNRLGLVDSKTAAESIIQNRKDALNYPMQPDVQQGLSEIMAGKGFMDTAGAVIRNPGAVVNVAVESLPGSVASAGAGLAGALAGAPLGPVGSIGGLMAGAGGMSAANEFGSGIIEGLTEAGIEPTAEAIQIALDSPAVMDAIQRKAGIKAAIVGAFDGLSMGVAGRVAKPISSVISGGKGRVAGVGGELAVQSGMGGAGEGVGEYAATGQVKPGAIALEMAAEIPGSAIEIPAAMMARPSARPPAPAPAQAFDPADFEVIGTVQPQGRVEPPALDIPEVTLVPENEAPPAPVVPGEPIQLPSVVDTPPAVDQVVDQAPEVVPAEQVPPPAEQVAAPEPAQAALPAPAPEPAPVSPQEPAPEPLPPEVSSPVPPEVEAPAAPAGGAVEQPAPTLPVEPEPAPAVEPEPAPVAAAPEPAPAPAPASAQPFELPPPDIERAAKRVASTKGDNILTTGQSSDGRQWVGSGSAMVVRDPKNKATARIAKAVDGAKEKRDVGGMIDGLLARTKNEVDTQASPIRWTGQVTIDGTENYVGVLPTGERVVVDPDLFNVLRATGGEIVVAGKPDTVKGGSIQNTLVARDPQGNIIGLGAPKRMSKERLAQLDNTEPGRPVVSEEYAKKRTDEISKELYKARQQLRKMEDPRSTATPKQVENLRAKIARLEAEDAELRPSRPAPKATANFVRTPAPTPAPATPEPAPAPAPAVEPEPAPAPASLQQEIDDALAVVAKGAGAVGEQGFGTSETTILSTTDPKAVAAIFDAKGWQRVQPGVYVSPDGRVSAGWSAPVKGNRLNFTVSDNWYGAVDGEGKVWTWKPGRPLTAEQAESRVREIARQMDLREAAVAAGRRDGMLRDDINELVGEIAALEKALGADIPGAAPVQAQGRNLVAAMSKGGGVKSPNKRKAPTAVAAEDRVLADADEKGLSARTQPSVPTTEPSSSLEEIGYGRFDERFADVSTSRGEAPISELAFKDAGLNPDVAVNLAPEAQMRVLRDLLKNTFGITVESGKANAREAIDQMLDAYRNVKFMLSSIGLPLRSIGLENSLTLELTRTSKKKKYLGAYFPAKQAIELPGRTNSFAHEWAHALDHWLMRTLGPNFNMLSVETRGAGLDTNRHPVFQPFVQVMNALFFNDARIAARVLELQTQAAQTIKKGDRAGEPTAAAIEAQELLDDMQAKLAAGNYRGIKALSDYFRSAKDFQPSSSYWTNPAEMIARAFEAYVAFKVDQAGGADANQFVSKGDRAYLDMADRRLRQTFPKGSERAAIFAAFDQLMDALRDNGVFGGDTTIATAPDMTDVLDPNQYVVARAMAPEEQSFAEELVADLKRMQNTLKGLLDPATRPETANAIRDTISERMGGGGPTNDRLSPANRAMDSVRAIATTVAGNMTRAAKRNAGRGREYLDAARKVFFREPGRGELQGETWTRAVTAKINVRMARISAALEQAGMRPNVPVLPKSPRGLETKAQRDRLYDLLTIGPAATAGATPDEVRAAAAIRREMDSVYRDAQGVGLDVGYVRDGGFMKRILNMGAVWNNPTAFEDKARQVYAIKFDKDVDANPEALGEFQSFVRGADPAFSSQPAVAAALAAIKAATKAKDATALAQATDTYTNLLRDRYAELAAKKYMERVLIGDAFTMDDAVGPDASSTQSRTLPIEASQIMKEFYVDDPVTATRSYITQMTRLIEYRRRLGTINGAADLDILLQRDENFLARVQQARLDMTKPADRARAIMEFTDVATTDRLQMLMTEAGRAGANPEDIQWMRGSVEFMSGKAKDGVDNPTAAASEALYVLGTLALLGRVAWTALSEPVVAVGRLQSFTAGAITLREYVRELTSRNSPDMREAKALAEAVGIVTSAFNEQAVQSIMDFQHADTPSSARVMAAFMEVNLQQPITNAQRRAAMKAVHWYLGQTLTEATGTNQIEAQRAKGELREYGIDDAMLAQMKAWIDGLNGRLPTIEEALSTPEGEKWAEVIREGVFTTIQEPDRGTKPKMASHRWGRLMFGLLSFAYTFMRNYQVRTYNRILRDAEIRQGAGAARGEALAKSALQNGGWMVGGFGAIMTAQLLTTIARESVMNGDEWERRQKENKLTEWLLGLAVSRSGIYGAFDPIVQGLTGLKFQRDLTALTAGPYTSLPLSFAQAIGNVIMNNSAKTNNQEYAAAKEAFRLFLAPSVALGLSTVPGSNIWRTPLLMWGTSNKAADAFATGLVGEKDATVRKREREQRRAAETPLERRRREERERRRAQER